MINLFSLYDKYEALLMLEHIIIYIKAEKTTESQGQLPSYEVNYRKAGDVAVS